MLLKFCLCVLALAQNAASNDYVDLMERFMEAEPIHPQIKTPDVWTPESTNRVRSKFTTNEPYNGAFQPNTDCSESRVDLKLGDYGFITSPNYPRNYPGRKSCEWQLKGPPGSRIQVVLLDAITQPYSILYSDYIMFARSGDFSIIDRLSGDMSSNMPMMIMSTENKLGLRFRSNTLFNFRGFKLQYLVVPDEKEVLAVRKFSAKAFDGVCGQSFTEFPSPEGDNAPASRPVVETSASAGGDDEFPIIKPKKKFAPVYTMGGVDILKYAYPWMVALLIDDKHFCAGSLIDDQHVMTAAHCTYRTSHIQLMLGSYKIKVKRGEPDDGRVLVNVTRRFVFQHPEYNPNTHAYDISIIRLREKIQFNDRIKPVCLPNRHYISRMFLDEQASVSGWGQHSDSNTRAGPYLKQDDVRVIPSEECRVAFRGVVNGNLVCTSTHQGTSPCKADSGGPLVVKEEGPQGPFYTQIGIVSFGAATCENGLPVAYTRVSAFIDFINEITGKTL